MRRGAAFLAVLAVIGLSLDADAIYGEEPQYPVDVAVAGDGTIYIADPQMPGIWKVAGGKLEPYFSAERKFGTPLSAVRCVAIDGQGRLLAGDSATRDVYRFDESAKPVPLTSGRIGMPMGIAVNTSGEIFVSDAETHRVWKIAADGGTPTKFADITAPRGLAFGNNNRLWVVSGGVPQLYRISTEGEAEPVVASRTFRYPHDVLVRTDGAVYVTDGYGKSVWKVDVDGKPTQWTTGETLMGPVGLALAGDKIIIADPRAKRIFQVDDAGSVSPLSFDNQ